MGPYNKIDYSSQISGFQEEIDQAALKGRDDFFTWYNSAKDTDMSFIRGSWDFTIHIADPIALYIKNPEEKTILEIGHGGGRILAAASRAFRNGIGIDIHNQNELVAEELKNRGIRNVTLFQSDGKSIPIESSQIDVIYSFIVLQHVEKIEIFEAYLLEVYRVLKTGGIAILYFGRKKGYSHNRKSILLYWLDNLVESITLYKLGYQEFSSNVNETNLVVSSRFAKNTARKIGFHVLKQVVSRRQVPDGIEKYGGQHGLVLIK
jgi:ubiquinone/menaquinone biosynthesis C-methylase UbiE